jgi:enoyl-CoA hydratase/carnithine racemase
MERVAIEQDGGVAEVRFTRGDKHNGLDFEMFEAIHGALDSLEADQGLRAVVLSGDGPSFCAGLDIKSFAGQDVSDVMLGRNGSEPANFAQRVAIGWRHLPVPVIAALHGACFGGGAQIGLAADLRIAAPDTRISIMEMRYGLIPDMGLSQLISGLVRDDIARELIYTAREVDATEAAELGLVTRVSETHLDDARSLAAQIAAAPPHAMRAAKRWMNEMPRLPEAAGLELEEELQRSMLGAAAQPGASAVSE